MPDGAAVSVVYRPFRWLRTELGGSYNMISKGVRGGVTLMPFGMGPSATLEAGRYFDGDANGLARSSPAAAPDNAFFSASATTTPMRTWAWISACAGWCSSSTAASLRPRQHPQLNSEISDGMSSGDMGSTAERPCRVNQDPIVRIFTPSVKLGFVFYIW